MKHKALFAVMALLPLRAAAPDDQGSLVKTKKQVTFKSDEELCQVKEFSILGDPEVYCGHKGHGVDWDDDGFDFDTEKGERKLLRHYCNGDWLTKKELEEQSKRIEKELAELRQYLKEMEKESDRLLEKTDAYLEQLRKSGL